MSDFSPLDTPSLGQPKHAAAAGSAARGAHLDEAKARRVAQEFEALLLAQLTASLQPAEDDAEESLFGGEGDGGGSALYQQMFSEQIATAMAKNGGVGLADVIIRHLRVDDPNQAGQTTALGSERAFAAARLLRSTASEATSAANPASTAPQAAVNAAANTAAAAAPFGVESATRPRRIFDVTTPAPQTSPALSTDAFGGAGLVDLQLPVRGRISSQFGIRRDPINGQHRHHQGIDIAAPRGTPIEAAAAGTVVFAGRQGGYGNTVVIEHADGRRTRYAHAERLLVAPGEIVRASQTIATVGSTGRSTGPHLHFEVFNRDQQIDPLGALANDFTLANR